MAQKDELKALMRSKVSGLALAQLVEVFEQTDVMDGPEVPDIRDVLLDELEFRDLTAFEAWLDSAVKSPRSFFFTV